MAEKQTNTWPKKITVDKRIVRILSGSTYANFPSAIKELITNSYDADAENVLININLSKEIIEMRDDGKGMNEEDFAFYLRIAGKSRKKKAYTEKKRRIIGQFGVGFLSVLPFCEKYIIETTRKGSSEVLHATISSYEYFSDDYQTLDVDEIPIPGGIRNNPEITNDQYTRIRLVGFSKLTSSFFKGKFKLKNLRNTKYNFEPIELLRWELSEYLPLRYDVTKGETASRLDQLFSDHSPIPFNVIFNNETLYRNIHADSILELSPEYESVGDIVFKYHISTNYNPIHPKEARYLMMRNLNVGVGDRTTFGLGMDGKVYGKLAHITGEVNIVEGLNELINVSRDKFNFSPDYEQLKDFLRGKLSWWANELDRIQSIQKTITNLENTTHVSDIENLKVDKINKEIESLESRGFHVKVEKDLNSENEFDNDLSRKLSIKIDKENREVVLNRVPDQFSKTITVRGKNIKLRSESWDFRGSSYPAIRKDGDITIINESYPLFQNNKQFDTFLKLHLLLTDYLDNHIININTYTSFCNDLLSTFENQ